MSGKSTRVRVARKQAIVNKGAKSGVSISQVGKHIGAARCIKIRNKMFQTFKSLYNLPLFTSLQRDQKLSEKQREMLRYCRHEQIHLRRFPVHGRRKRVSRKT